MKTRSWDYFCQEATETIKAQCQKNQNLMLIDLLPALATIRQNAAVELKHEDERGSQVFGEVVPRGLCVRGVERPDVFNNYIFNLFADNFDKNDPNTIAFIQKQSTPTDDNNYHLFRGVISYPHYSPEDKILLSDDELDGILIYLEYVLGEYSRPFDAMKEILTDHDAHPLSSIHCWRDTSIQSPTIENKGFIMQLDYPKNTIYTLFHHFTFLEKCFKKLMAWDKEKDSTNDFISTSAKLLYMMVHRLHYTRGTSSIAEWIIQGVGEFKGINFPAKLHEAPEDWRWRALMEPDCEVFAQWFAKTITPKISLAATELQAQPTGSELSRLFSVNSSATAAAAASIATAGTSESSVLKNN